MTPKAITIFIRKKLKMKILTFTDSLELEHFEKIAFDYEKAMVGFIKEGFKKEYYFKTPGCAMEFVREIIEALYSGSKEVDLSFFRTVPNSCMIRLLNEEIQNRLNGFQHEE